MTVAVRLGLRGAATRAARRSRRSCRRSAVALVAAAFRHDVHGAGRSCSPGCSRPAARRSSSRSRCARSARRARRSRSAPRRSSRSRSRSSSSASRCALPLVVGALAVVARRRSARGRARPARAPARRAGCSTRRARRRSSRRATTSCARCTRTRRPRPRRPRRSSPGTLVAALWTRRPPTARELRRLAPAGVLFGLSYVCLFEAYWRGRVTRRLAARRDRVALGRRARGAPDPPDRGDGAEARARRAAVVAGGAADRRDSLAVRR